jgi:hypothetical protein
MSLSKKSPKRSPALFSSNLTDNFYSGEKADEKFGLLLQFSAKNIAQS